MRVLICGDRHYPHWARIYTYLGTLPPDTIIIHGDQRGADRMAGQVAENLGLEVHEYPADWDNLGRAAGVIRNQVMLDSEHPDLVVGFHDNLAESKGTKDMLTRAHMQGYRTYLRDNLGLWSWPRGANEGADG